MEEKFSKAEVKRLLPPKLINQLNLEESHQVKTCSPVDLLTPERFDVFADTIYAKFHLLNAAQNWSLNIYRECKRILGESQADRFYSTSIEDSLEDFQDLIRQFKAGSFPEDENCLPVNQENVIINSSHQFAASLAFNQPITTIQFQHKPIRYDFQYFLDRGMDQEVADAMALDFTRRHPNMAVVVIFPIAAGKDTEINKILSEYGQVAYEKEIYFTKFGQYNLIQLLYLNMHWIDPGGDINYGVRHHVDHRFWKDGPVRFIFFTFDEGSKTKEMKTQLRALFDLKNFSIHITDTHNETLRIAEQFLTPNSVSFMNHSQPWWSKQFLKHLKEFKQALEAMEFNKDHFCLTGSAIFAAYGLQDLDKVEFISSDKKSALSINTGSFYYDDNISREVNSIKDLIFDPGNFFYIRGIKIISPHLLTKIYSKEKSQQYRKKLQLIDSLEGKTTNFHQAWWDFRFLMKITAVKILNIDLQRIKNAIPDSIRLPIKKFYRFFFGKDTEK